jgi:hypothetical protein
MKRSDAVRELVEGLEDRFEIAARAARDAIGRTQVQIARWVERSGIRYDWRTKQVC